MTLVERPTIEQVTETFRHLPDDELLKTVSNRLRGLRINAFPRLGLGRDEDPSDVFVDMYDLYKDNSEHQPTLDRLRKVCTTLTSRWATRDFVQTEKDALAMGELFYLSARIKAKDTIPDIAKVAGDDHFSRVFIEGEDLQSRALRSLGSLLSKEDQEANNQYKPLFEAALEAKRPIGLTALVHFWPEERETFVEKAKTKNDEGLNNVVENLDMILPTFTED
ncbi:MAG: hypothetical protein Q7R49_06645 [Candidatus Daviesbacteria bacterium]|nr:hypothetical protein [Candidatus Daviesbacteria bacterium]